MKRKSPHHGGPQNKLTNFIESPHQSCACVPNPKIFTNKDKFDTLQNEASKCIVSVLAHSALKPLETLKLKP